MSDLPWSIRAIAEEPITVERAAPDRPHAGKVLAAIQAHADDIPLFCAGTVAKLVAEGYTAYLIQTTNDEMCGPSPSIGETVLTNEREVQALAAMLGFQRCFFLGYRNHLLDDSSAVELRARLIFLFRLLKVDTVLTFNPSGQQEENPDHRVTARAVEAARWMAGMDKDYPEHFAAGLAPHAVRESYFWVARDGQPYNRVVEIGAQVEAKVAAISANKAQGPGGATGRRLKVSLAERGLKLPLLEAAGEAVGEAAEEAAGEAADRAYIRRFLLEDDRRIGRPYGLEYAERFYYQGPGDGGVLRDYISVNAVPL